MIKDKVEDSFAGQSPGEKVQGDFAVPHFLNSNIFNIPQLLLFTFKGIWL